MRSQGGKAGAGVRKLTFLFFLRALELKMESDGREESRGVLLLVPERY